VEKIKNIRVDWPNHVVGFLSALLGIYIGFRLEGVREDHQERKRIEIVKQSIKNEIENNLRIYEQNIEALSDWLDYYAICSEKLDGEKHLILGTSEYRKITSKHPTRFTNLKQIRTLDDTLSVFDWSPVVDVAPATGLSTSSWKAGIASGLLNSMDYALVDNLSAIYDWIEKDIGANEKDFYENMLGLRSNDITNLRQLVLDYQIIVKIYAFKRDRIRRIYDNIQWTN